MYVCMAMYHVCMWHIVDEPGSSKLSYLHMEVGQTTTNIYNQFVFTRHANSANSVLVNFGIFKIVFM